MQRVAAYILERAADCRSPEARKTEGDRLRAVIEAWLKGKGSTSLDGAGNYVAIDGSDANCRVSTIVDGERSWRMFELSEVTPEGRKFVTTVSVTVGNKNVVVFVTMEVGSVATLITRIEVDAKCPKVVRDLLAQPGSWCHGASPLQSLTKLDGFEAGESLGLEIQHANRTIPSVVVSRVQGQLALPRLDQWLANDLAGVANVYSVDEPASWALTDILRKPLSTYGGALRIYWPRLALNDDPFRHQLWTATRLQGIEPDSQIAVDRIRRQLRTIIMRASAASVVRPSEIDDIRAAAARAEYSALQAHASELKELKTKASSLEDFKDIADSYEMQRLESNNQALIFKFGQARAVADEAAEVQSDAPERDEAAQPPTPGETRYYKKTYSKPAYDVLVRVDDCGHNTWQNSAKAEKAKKGLARLLGEHGEWRNLQHCGSCTGGGMWRVKW